MFPLLIGDLIPQDDEPFLLIIQLLRIMDIVFSRRIKIEHTVMLEDMIRIFFIDFQKCFPHVRPINKFHHLVHYPDALRQHGPAFNFSCMRYEAFHNKSKRIAMANHNFINISYSVSIYLCQNFSLMF